MKEKVKELQIHDKDTGSSEVQIAQLTGKIENLSKHIKQFKKDKHSSVGLLRAVNRRKKLLDYLKKNKFFEFRRNKIGKHLRDIQGENTVMKIKGKAVRVWKIPSFDSSDVQINIPSFKPKESPF